MAPLPPADLLAYAGMGFVALFALWKTKVTPFLARRRADGSGA